MSLCLWPLTMAVRIPGDVGVRFHGIQFACFDQGGEHGQFWAPVSWPANRAFLRFRAMGRYGSLDRVIVDLDPAIG